MFFIETPMAYDLATVRSSKVSSDGKEVAELPGKMKIFTDVDEKHLSNEKTLVNFCIEGVILPS